MAKKEMGSVSAGLFFEAAQPAAPPQSFSSPTRKEEAPSLIQKKQGKNPQIGRPKAADLTEDTRLIRKTLYITPEQNKMLAYYGIDNNMDFSETLRSLINQFFKSQEEHSQ